MTFSTRDIEEEMDTIFDRLSTAVEEMRTMVDEAARAEVAFKSAYAQALLRARASTPKPPVAEVEAMATLAAESELLEHKVTAGKERAQRELLAALRSRLDGLRTVCANLRAVA